VTGISSLKSRQGNELACAAWERPPISALVMMLPKVNTTVDLPAQCG